MCNFLKPREKWIKIEIKRIHFENVAPFRMEPTKIAKNLSQISNLESIFANGRQDSPIFVQFMKFNSKFAVVNFRAWKIAISLRIISSGRNKILLSSSEICGKFGKNV